MKKWNVAEDDEDIIRWLLIGAIVLTMLNMLL